MKGSLKLIFGMILTVLFAVSVIGYSDVDGKKPGFHLVASISVDGGANMADEPRGIACDKEGNVYVTGYVTVQGGGTKIWLAKYDKKLVLQTSTTVKGSADGDDVGYAIAIGGDGYLYVIGYITEVAGQDHDIWIAKYDTDLVFQKQITINGSANSIDEGYGIICDGTGNLYVTGTVTETTGTVESYNIWVAKYDTELNPQKSFTLDGPANDTDKGRFLALDKDGNLFVSGSMSQADSGYDIWLGKFDNDLNLLQETIVAGLTNEDQEDKGYGILIDGKGVIYVTGTIITEVTEVGRNYDIWLAKYDRDLNLKKSVIITGPVNGEDVAYSIVLKNGYLYQTGVYTEATGGSNIWVARYKKNLKLQDSFTINGSANGYDTGLGIAKGKGRNFYVSGSINEDPGGLNIWLARFKMSP